MGSQLDRITALLEISKAHRDAWKSAHKRSQEKNDEHVAVKMTTGIIISFTATILLIISFSTPNWMESRSHAYSEFVKLGLWEICLNNYFHHSFQFHYAFSGCHWVYSREYRVIWEFIMPPWFLAVQGLVTICLILSLISCFLVGAIWRNFVPRLHIIFLKISAVHNATTALLLLISIIIFGIKAQGQRWMPHQLYNFYSWSFWLTFVSILVHAVSAIFLGKESQRRKIHLIRPETPKNLNPPRSNQLAYGQILSTIIIDDFGAKI